MKTNTRLPKDFEKFAGKFNDVWQVQIPRTGSTYALHAMQWAGLVDLAEENASMPGHEHCCEGHLRFINGSVRLKPRFINSFRFSVIRNPYSHLVSMYEYEKRTVRHNSFFHCDVTHTSFDEFIELTVNSPIYDWCKIKIMQDFMTAQTFDERGNSQVHALVRNEFIDDGLKAILESVNIDLPGQYEEGFALRGDRVNLSTPDKKAYLRYYDNEKTRKLVEEYWGRELKAYGYTIDGPTDNYCIINPQHVNYSPTTGKFSTNPKITLGSRLRMPVEGEVKARKPRKNKLDDICDSPAHKHHNRRRFSGRPR